MQLNDAQKQAVMKWAAEGDSLSDIQKKMTAEFGVSLTYMDVRLLVLELGAGIKDRKQSIGTDISKPAPKPAEPAQDDIEDVPAGGDAGEMGDIPAAGGVKVELDRLVRPGFIMSGTAIFSDGTKAGWMIDQMGRLMLDPETKGYKPSPGDLADFQNKLRMIFESRGY